MAAQSESSFGCAPRPNGLQEDAHRRKNRNVKNREQAVLQFFRLLELKRNPSKSQVDHARPAVALLADDRVSVGPGHRNTLGFSLHGINGRGSRDRGILTREGFGGHGTSHLEFAGKLLCGPFRGKGNSWRGGVKGRSLSRVRKAKAILASLIVTRMFQAVEALVGDANELLGLFAILRESRDAVVHGNRKGESERTEYFDENGFHATAEGQRLNGLGLRKEQGKLISADAKRGVGGTQSPAKGCGGRSENLIATRMAVLVVYLLKAVEIENDKAERRAIAAGPSEFFFEGFREKPSIVETRKRIRHRAYLKLAVLFVFHHHGNTDQTSAEKNVHKNRFKCNGTAKLLGELSASCKHLFPELQALGFVQVQVRDGAKVALEKLAARRNLQPFEHFCKELEISFFSRQTRSR